MSSGNCKDCGDTDDDDSIRIMHCSSCNITSCRPHLVVMGVNDKEKELCDECNEKAVAWILDINELIVDLLHQWERILSMEKSVWPNMKSMGLLDLADEHKKIQQQWEDMSTEVNFAIERETKSREAGFSNEQIRRKYGGITHDKSIDVGTYLLNDL